MTHQQVSFGKPFHMSSSIIFGHSTKNQRQTVCMAIIPKHYKWSNDHFVDSSLSSSINWRKCVMINTCIILVLWCGGIVLKMICFQLWIKYNARKNLQTKFLSAPKLDKAMRIHSPRPLELSKISYIVVARRQPI